MPLSEILLAVVAVLILLMYHVALINMSRDFWGWGKRLSAATGIVMLVIIDAIVASLILYSLGM